MTLNTNDSEIDLILDRFGTDIVGRYTEPIYQEALEKANKRLNALIATRIVEELESLITRYSEPHIVRKTIVYGSDKVSKGSRLGMIPTLYVNDRISKLKQGNSND